MPDTTTGGHTFLPLYPDEIRGRSIEDLQDSVQIQRMVLERILGAGEALGVHPHFAKIDWFTDPDQLAALPHDCALPGCLADRDQACTGIRMNETPVVLFVTFSGAPCGRCRP